jgi:hypothetical protein
VGTHPGAFTPGPVLASIHPVPVRNLPTAHILPGEFEILVGNLPTCPRIPNSPLLDARYVYFTLFSIFACTRIHPSRPHQGHTTHHTPSQCRCHGYPSVQLRRRNSPTPMATYPPPRTSCQQVKAGPDLPQRVASQSLFAVR